MAKLNYGKKFANNYTTATQSEKEEYKESLKAIKLVILDSRGAYKFKEGLKRMGFKFNPVTKQWFMSAKSLSYIEMFIPKIIELDLDFAISKGYGLSRLDSSDSCFDRYKIKLSKLPTKINPTVKLIKSSSIPLP